jgi:hypothetical protein
MCYVSDCWFCSRHVQCAWRTPQRFSRLASGRALDNNIHWSDKIIISSSLQEHGSVWDWGAVGRVEKHVGLIVEAQTALVLRISIVERQHLDNNRDRPGQGDEGIFRYTRHRSRRARDYNVH